MRASSLWSAATPSRMIAARRRCTSRLRVAPASWYTTSRIIWRGKAYPSNSCDPASTVPSLSHSPCRSSSMARKPSNSSSPATWQRRSKLSPSSSADAVTSNVQAEGESRASWERMSSRRVCGISSPADVCVNRSGLTTSPQAPLSCREGKMMPWAISPLRVSIRYSG
jgi:hypothetical protein